MKQFDLGGIRLRIKVSLHYSEVMILLEGGLQCSIAESDEQLTSRKGSSMHHIQPM
jgi:hypothetical protein